MLFDLKKKNDITKQLFYLLLKFIFIFNISEILYDKFNNWFNQT